MYEIKTTKLLKEVMQNYFLELDKGDKKIAWCTSVGPAELLRSFGFEVYFPENHGALLGASRTAGNYIPVAQKSGYSNQICSYTSSDIGSFLSNESPLQKHYGIKGIPKPNLIVYCTNQCREVEDWFTFFADRFKCPIAGIHPPRYLNEVSAEEIKLVVTQLNKLVNVCEQVTNTKFSKEKFSEVLKLSKDATLLWQKVLNTSTSSPAPLSFFDGTIHMGPIVVLRGTQVAKNYYEVLLAELEANVNNGIGFLQEENSRIFWDGMPIWGKLRSLSTLFSQNNASVVASTYCNSWIFDDFDENNPFESSALAYTGIFINRSEKAKFEFFRKWIKDFKIGGVIFHDSKTCFNNSNARFGMPVRVKEEFGVPTLVIEGDLNDLRFYSEGQSISKIEAFIEQIENQKIST